MNGQRVPTIKWHRQTNTYTIGRSVVHHDTTYMLSYLQKKGYTFSEACEAIKNIKHGA